MPRKKTCTAAGGVFRKPHARKGRKGFVKSACAGVGAKRGLRGALYIEKTSKSGKVYRKYI